MRLHALIWPWLPHVIRAVYRLEVSGREHVPPKAGCSSSRTISRRSTRLRSPPRSGGRSTTWRRRSCGSTARSAGRWTSSAVSPSAGVAVTVRPSRRVRASSAQARPWGCSPRVTSVAKGRGSGAPRRWRSRQAHPSCRSGCSTPIAPSRAATSASRSCAPRSASQSRSCRGSATVAAARELTDRFRAADRGARRPRLTPAGTLVGCQDDAGRWQTRIRRSGRPTPRSGRRTSAGSSGCSAPTGRGSPPSAG